MVTRALSFLLTLALVVPVVPLLGQGKPSDNKIYDQVRQKLANDPEVKGANLDVVVKNGQVTLTGTVNDIRAKEKAEKDTKKVKGVTSVINELKLFGS